MLGSCRLNNKSMRNVRRTDAYQAITIDLALLGIITKEECEMLIDGGIPSGIALPDGTSRLTSEDALPPKPDFIQTEPDDEGPVDDTDDEGPVDNTDDEGPVDNTDDEGPVDNTEPDETQESVDDEGRPESDN